MRAPRRCLAALLAAVPALAATLGATGATAQAAEDDAPASSPPPKSLILADLGLHVVGVGFQRTVHPRIALQADLDWYVPWTQTEDTLDTMGGVLRLRPVFYLTEGAPEGLWLSPFVQGGVARADRAGTTEVGPTAALGASIGYAWLIADHLHLAVGGGAQMHAVSIPGGTGAPSYFDAYPHVDGTVGYAF